MRIDAINAAEARRRDRAARELDAIVAAPIFRALCEPARIEILKVLTRRGRSDVGTIAGDLPQDQSVVSRHLAVLRRAGLVRREKVGRRALFEMDGPAAVRALEDVLERFRGVMPLCCPGPAPEGRSAGRERSGRRKERAAR